MQMSQQSIPRPSIQGDPASRIFGYFLLTTLAVITIGVIIGIAAGNTAHYRYYGPTNSTNISTVILLNDTIFQRDINGENSRLWLSTNERLKRSYSSRKTRLSWSLTEKPANNRRW